MAAGTGTVQVGNTYEGSDGCLPLWVFIKKGDPDLSQKGWKDERQWVQLAARKIQNRCRKNIIHSKTLQTINYAFSDLGYSQKAIRRGPEQPTLSSELVLLWIGTSRWLSEAFSKLKLLWFCKHSFYDNSHCEPTQRLKLTNTCIKKCIHLFLSISLLQFLGQWSNQDQTKINILTASAGNFR